MPEAYAYKPRFVDIRIKPPKPDAPKPEERKCDWPECGSKGTCRAPKSAEKLREYYYFCPTHAAEYNKNWDFFAEMDEADVEDFQRSAATGHRPTWNTQSAARQRDAASWAKRDWSRAFADGFGLFGDGRPPPPEKRGRKLGKLERTAFDTLGLDHEATGEDVRARYTELVKRYHPDANGGDRTSEHRLTLVIRAYKTLKKSGLA